MYTVMYIVSFNWLRVLVALRPLVLYQKAINNNNNNIHFVSVYIIYGATPLLRTCEPTACSSGGPTQFRITSMVCKDSGIRNLNFCKYSCNILYFCIYY